MEIPSSNCKIYKVKVNLQVPQKPSNFISRLWSYAGVTSSSGVGAPLEETGLIHTCAIDAKSLGNLIIKMKEEEKGVLFNQFQKLSPFKIQM